MTTYDRDAAPTSEDLKSGDFSFMTPGHRTTPPPPQQEGDETSSPSNRPSCPQIELELPMFTLTTGKREEDI